MGSEKGGNCLKREDGKSGKVEACRYSSLYSRFLDPYVALFLTTKLPQTSLSVAGTPTHSLGLQLSADSPIFHNWSITLPHSGVPLVKSRPRATSPEAQAYTCGLQGSHRHPLREGLPLLEDSCWSLVAAWLKALVP